MAHEWNSKKLLLLLLCVISSQLMVGEHLDKAAKFFGVLPAYIHRIDRKENKSPVGGFGSYTEGHQNSSTFSRQNMCQTASQMMLNYGMMAGLGVVTMYGGTVCGYVYNNYWLTPEERLEALKQQEKAREYQENYAVVIGLQARLAKEPYWKELLIKEKEMETQQRLQAIQLAQQRLYDNELGLQETARKEEEAKIRHLEEMLTKVDPAEREALNKDYKEYVAFCARKNMESR